MVDSTLQNLSDGGALQATDLVYGVRPGAAEGSRDFKFTGANVGGGGGVDLAARNNTALNRFHIAINQTLTLGDMADGISDVYTDETGIDAAASSNEEYDSSGDFYHNDPSTFQADIGTESGAIADGEASGSFLDDFAFDDDDVSRWASAVAQPAIGGWIGQDFGAANDKVLRRVTIQQADAAGNRVFGTDSVSVESSPDNSVWTNVVDLSPVSDNLVQAFLVPASTARRYWRLFQNTAVTTPSAVWSVKEAEFQEATVSANISLRSEAFVALAQPDDVQVLLLEEDLSGPHTLNTDILVFASRDDGTTWTEGTLTEIGDFDATKRILAADIDVSAQPAGTDIKYRVDTANLKVIRVHAASGMWR